MSNMENWGEMPSRELGRLSYQNEIVPKKSYICGLSHSRIPHKRMIILLRWQYHHHPGTEMQIL